MNAGGARDDLVDAWPEDLVRRFSALPVGAEFTVRDLLPRPVGVTLLTHFVQDAVARGRAEVVGKRPALVRCPPLRATDRATRRAVWLRVLKRVA